MHRSRPRTKTRKYDQQSWMISGWCPWHHMWWRPWSSCCFSIWGHRSASTSCSLHTRTRWEWRTLLSAYCTGPSLTWTGAAWLWRIHFLTCPTALIPSSLTSLDKNWRRQEWAQYGTQYARPGHSKFDTLVSSTGALQENVLSLVLFTLYTKTFNYNSESYHVQKFFGQQEDECRKLIQDRNHLESPGSTKTKEMVVDFKEAQAPLWAYVHQWCQCGVSADQEILLGVPLDEKLDWIYSLCKIGHLNTYNKILLMFYLSVVASVCFYAGVR